MTFALGTAVGDLIAEGLGVGYFWTGVLCAGLIALITIAWRLGLDASARVLDRLHPHPAARGLDRGLPRPAFGQRWTGPRGRHDSAIFLTAIVLTIAYLSVRKRDVITVPDDAAELAELDEPETAPHHRVQCRRSALVQTVVVLALFVIVGGTFYAVRTNTLDAQAAAIGDQTAFPLGDMSQYVIITQDTLSLLESGQQAAATARITDLETAWDESTATLKRGDQAAWTGVDDKIDAVLRELRSTSPNPTTEKAALEDLLSKWERRPAGVVRGRRGRRTPLTRTAGARPR